MKRDWAVMRDILIVFEEAKTHDDVEGLVEKIIPEEPGDSIDPNNKTEQNKREKYEQFMHNFYLLTKGEFINDYHIERTLDGMYARGVSSFPELTMSGHDLLETIRDKSTLKKMLKFAADKGVVVSLQTISNLAALYTRSLFS